MREGSRGIWRKHPIALPLMIIWVTGAVGFLGYIIYNHTIREKRLHNYPSHVASPLRKALYYTEIDLKPAEALKWYKKALIVADQLEMDPFSDEVLGIRLRVTAMLEQAGLTKGAIGMLEKIQTDCQQWVENGRRKQMIVDKERSSKKSPKPSSDPEAVEAERQVRESEVREEIQRSKVMKKVVGVRIKLAELYSTDGVHQMDKAENALTSAVEASVTELQRRRSLNLPVNSEAGQDFTNLTEIATAYTELADLYVKQSKNDLAAILYMQALSMIKEDEGKSTTCAQVVLLNNVASQMAEQAQKPGSSATSSVNTPDGQPISRTQLLNAADQWARKALDVAVHIKPPVRNEECDQACLTAMFNIGEIAIIQGDKAAARQCYQDVRSLASRLGFEEGVQRADEALRSLKNQK